jgi:anti-anti-sigma factor
MLNFETYTDQAAEPFVVDTLPDRERVVVAPRGELDIATVGDVAAEIDALERVGFVELVLDLRAVAFMDVSGLRLVVGQARRADVSVELIDGPPAVARLFDLARVRDGLPFLSPQEIARRRY